MPYNSAHTGLTIDEGITKALTALQPEDVAEVATSGSYNDLTDKPSVQPSLRQKRVSWAQATGNTTTLNSTGLNVAGTGTATAVNVATTNIYTIIRSIEYAVTAAATTAVAGWRSAAAQFFRGNPSNLLGGFKFGCRFGRSRGVAANATLRGFTGLAGSTGAATDVETSAYSDLLGVGFDAADTNWQIMYRTGTAAVTKVDTGFPKAVADSSEMYDLQIEASPADNNVRFTFTRLSNGAVFAHTATSNLPAATTLLAPRGQYSVGGTSSVIGYALAAVYIETDY